VLAGLERRPRELEMGVARRADVDQVDILALEELAWIVSRGRDVEGPRRVARAIDRDIADRDDSAARIAVIAGQMRRPGPGSRAEDADPDKSWRCLGP